MIPEGLGPVTIGPREIYDAVVQLRRAAERLDDRIGDVVRDVGDHEVRLRILEQGDATRTVPDHEARLRALERGRWPLPSLAALISIAALVITVVQQL